MPQCTCPMSLCGLRLLPAVPSGALEATTPVVYSQTANSGSFSGQAASVTQVTAAAVVSRSVPTLAKASAI